MCYVVASTRVGVHKDDSDDSKITAAKGLLRDSFPKRERKKEREIRKGRKWRLPSRATVSHAREPSAEPTNQRLGSTVKLSKCLSGSAARRQSLARWGTIWRETFVTGARERREPSAPSRSLGEPSGEAICDASEVGAKKKNLIKK